jgi:signal transduction histidine kinase
MALIPFTVSARTAKLIGLENFSNANGAIVELVKNTYDADSRNCTIIFVNHGKYSTNPSIYIIDDGIGMTDKVIKNQWMTIGTDDKLQNYTSLSGRIKTGAKGIGRFALNRLGTTSKLSTISQETKEGYVWDVDWRDFDKPNATINQVKAKLKIVQPKKIIDNFNMQFVNFRHIIDKVIKNTIIEHGTIINISGLNDSWDYDSIKKIYEDLEVLIPPKEQPYFDIYLFSTSHPEDFGKVNTAYYDDYDYKLTAHYLADVNKTVNIEITRNELDINLLKTHYSDLFSFDKMKKFPYRLKNFQEKTFQISPSLDQFKGFTSNIDKELLNKIGEFTFTFYFIKNTISDDKKDSDTKKYPYRNINSANRKAWLKRFGGVKIFRDEFRVRPYGENGEDWLKLGERQAQSPGGAGQRLGGYRIRPNQVSGTVSISRITNTYFQDKSGREGIQETPVFELFKNILIEIIGYFETDRNTIMYYLSELYKNQHKEDSKIKAKKIAEETTNTESPSGKDAETTETSDKIKVLSRGFLALEEELDEKEEELRLLRNLASTGLIISSFAHELKNLRLRLIARTNDLADELKKYINEDDIKDIYTEDDPFYMIQVIQQEDNKLRHWLEYSINSLRRDKRQRKNIDFNRYFHDFKSIWENILRDKNITINLENKITDRYIFRGFEVDLDSVFNNFLTNSIEFLARKRTQKKEIIISYKLIDDYMEIIFYDNGIGLAEEYKNNPDVIFNSFESSKKDKLGNAIGTGLGLYIAKSIIDEYADSSIQILDHNDCFSLRILLKLRKYNG